MRGSANASTTREGRMEMGPQGEDLPRQRRARQSPSAGPSDPCGPATATLEQLNDFNRSTEAFLFMLRVIGKENQAKSGKRNSGSDDEKSRMTRANRIRIRRDFDNAWTAMQPVPEEDDDACP